MARFLHRKNILSICNRRDLLLAFFWLSGILAGIRMYACSGISFASWMRGSLGAVSIVSLTTVTLLPFLLSAIAVSLSCRWLIYPLAIGKGLSFSFVSMGCLCSFGCSGWLIGCLFCFSELISVPMLYWFWLRCLRGKGKGFAAEVTLLCSLCFLIGSVDYCLVSPFLAMLINL